LKSYLIIDCFENLAKYSYYFKQTNLKKIQSDFLPRIITIKNKVFMAKVLKAKKTTSKTRVLINPLIEGMYFEQIHNPLFSEFREVSWQKPGIKDFYLKSFQLNACFKEYKINLTEKRKIINGRLSSFLRIYNRAPYVVKASEYYRKFELKLAVKKDQVIEEMLELYRDRIENFTRENLESLNIIDLMFLQANLDLSGSRSRGGEGRRKFIRKCKLLFKFRRKIRRFSFIIRYAISGCREQKIPRIKNKTVL
jgi:hypothetical protein